MSQEQQTANTDVDNPNLFKQLAVGLRNLCQAEKKAAVFKPEEVCKMKIIVPPNGQTLSVLTLTLAQSTVCNSIHLMKTQK